MQVNSAYVLLDVSNVTTGDNTAV